MTVNGAHFCGRKQCAWLYVVAGSESVGTVMAARRGAARVAMGRQDTRPNDCTTPSRDHIVERLLSPALTRTRVGVVGAPVPGTGVVLLQRPPVLQH